MNWKLVIIGGVVYYIVTMILGFGVTGPLIHEGILDATYQEHQSFWRPELNEDPPNLAPLMPRWLIGGLVGSLVFAAIFSCVASSLGGVNLMSGLKYGLIVAVLFAVFAIGYSGVFALPDSLWIWWTLEGLLVNPVGGAAMGWAGGKWA